MSTHANGARAGGVDSRVSDSPFVSVRYHVDAWSGDYDQTELDVHDMLRERVAERDAILASVRDHEAVREHLVRGLHRYEPRDIVRSLHEGLSLHEQLGRVEAQIEGLQQHIEALQATRAALRELRMELRDVARSGGVAVNEQAAKLAQASRKMLALADEQHEEVAQAILQGPCSG